MKNTLFVVIVILVFLVVGGLAVGIFFATRPKKTGDMSGANTSGTSGTSAASGTGTGTISAPPPVSVPLQPKEVYGLAPYLWLRSEAEAQCAKHNATVATYAQLEAAQAAGADWELFFVGRADKK